MAGRIENIEKYQFKRQDYVHNRAAYMTGGHWNREKLLKDARRVAKSTNQRLLRLEQQGMTSSAAYRGAVKALEGVYSKTPVTWGKVSKEGKPRFKERVKSLSNEELLSLLFMAGHTQQAKTSTVKGVKAVYNQGMENLKSMVGQPYAGDLTYNDLIDLFRNEAYNQANKLYGYRAVIQLVDEMKDKGSSDEEIADQIGQAVAKADNLMDVRKRLGLGRQAPADDGWIEAP